MTGKGQEPTVSVVAPCFNGGVFLPSLVASLAAQTFHDYEVIVVDDGSTDTATHAALRRLPPFWRVMRQANRGLPGARNTGFREAQGRYVLPLDCDDGIAPDFLARGVTLLDEASPEVGFVFSHMQLFGGRQGVLRRRFNRFDQLYLNQLPYALLMRREAWHKAGEYDETMRDGYEDWEFNLRLIKAGYVGARLDAPLFRYFVRPDGMLLSHSAKKHGRIWRTIREKHPDLYERDAVRQAFRAPDNEDGRVSRLMAAGLTIAAKTLPDRGFGELFGLLLLAKTGVSRASASRS